MNNDGYPEESELKRIREWPGDDIKGLMEYIEQQWQYPNYFREGRKYYYLSTGGWSGNESIMEALQENLIFWLFYWQSSVRGGHYKFTKKVR